MYFYECLDEYLKLIDDHVYTIDELRDITETLIEYIEVEDYYDGIEFNIPNTLDLGTYSFLTKRLTLLRNFLIITAKKDFKAANLTNNRIAFINLSILEALFHEVVHVMQNYIAFDSNWTLAPLLKLDVVFFNNNTVSDEDYDRYHDFFLTERDANTTAIEYILCIICTYIHDDELYEFFKERLHGFMIGDYRVEGDKVISPLTFVYETIYKLDAPYVHGMDLYDRIKLGFPISLEEYNAFIRDENEIILAKNHLK